MKYSWEISIRGSLVVQGTPKVFKSYDEAKKDLIHFIKTVFDTQVRIPGVAYNYTIYDMEI